MTDAVTRSSTPARSAPKSSVRPQPPADDVRAMSEAFSRARGDAKGLAGRGGLPQQPQGEGQVQVGTPQVAADPRAELARAAGWRAADERGTADRRDAERGGEQALGLVSPAHAPPPAAAAVAAPPPHVDPSAFAQVLADLWTRENGRGDRQVRVRFGAEAWPATGALMVQTADGLLDLTVDMAPGSQPRSMAALADALGEAGLSVGRLTTAEAAG